MLIVIFVILSINFADARQMQFRGYSPKTGLTYYCDTVTINNKTGYQTCSIKGRSVATDIILQQSTGMHDVDGTLMYEGDKVATPDIANGVIMFGSLLNYIGFMIATPNNAFPFGDLSTYPVDLWSKVLK